MASGVQQHMWGPTPDADSDQWFTPDWLAERVVAWAGIDEASRVLELGAGDGSFVAPILDAGASLVAVERDWRFVETLRSMRPVPGSSYEVVHGDALTFDPGNFVADLCVGNPPYSKPTDADIAFVERGLELAPRVVAVLRLVFLAGKARYERIWSKHRLARIAYLPERPRFIGEKNGSALADFAVFDIRRGVSPGVMTETAWWVR